MMPLKPSVLMILIILTATFMLISCGTSTTISVKSGQSIQAAIKAAHPGDTIEVYSGIYHESLMINKPITLRGIDSGSGHPTINVNEGSAITLNAGGIILEGIQATAAGALETDAGIKVVSNGNIIRNNIASDGRSAGIALIGTKNNTIMDNVANGNSNYGISWPLFSWPIYRSSLGANGVLFCLLQSTMAADATTNTNNADTGIKYELLDTAVVLLEAIGVSESVIGSS